MPSRSNHSTACSVEKTRHRHGSSQDAPDSCACRPPDTRLAAILRPQARRGVWTASCRPPVDQRDMRPDRYVPAHGVIDHGLARSIVQMIVAADHMGNAHVVIVYDHGQHIDRRAVTAQNDHVIELVIAEFYTALHRIRDHGLAVLRCLDTDCKRRIRMGRRIGITPGLAKQGRASLGLRCLTKSRDVFLWWRSTCRRARWPASLGPPRRDAWHRRPD